MGDQRSIRLVESAGHALIDRALYLPRSWAGTRPAVMTPESPQQAGFRDQPALAKALITRALAAKVPAAWVAGDEVYGANPRLRAAIRDHGLGYVLAVSANRRMPTAAGPIRVDRLPAMLPRRAWQKHSAGAGGHGPASIPGRGSRCWPKTPLTPVSNKAFRRHRGEDQRPNISARSTLGHPW